MSVVIKIPSPEWDRLQKRRAELIYDQRREGLSRAEQKELAMLNRQSREAINAAFPAPPGVTEELTEVVARVEQRQCQKDGDD